MGQPTLRALNSFISSSSSLPSSDNSSASSFSPSTSIEPSVQRHRGASVCPQPSTPAYPQCEPLDMQRSDTVQVYRLLISPCKLPLTLAFILDDTIGKLPAFLHASLLSSFIPISAFKYCDRPTKRWRTTTHQHRQSLTTAGWDIQSLGALKILRGMVAKNWVQYIEHSGTKSASACFMPRR
jgi:hypothetical protein